MDRRRREFLKLAAAAPLVGCAAPAAAVPTTAAAGTRSTAMRTRPLMTLRLETAKPQNLGAGRVTFPITGGSFTGDRLRGRVLPGGDDWTSTRADGVIELDLRVTLETDDGALVYMTFEGIRNDAASYFRTLPRFETAAPKYAFLNRMLAVGVGEIRADGPVHVIEEIA
jgi:hypothetical protein